MPLTAWSTSRSSTKGFQSGYNRALPTFTTGILKIANNIQIVMLASSLISNGHLQHSSSSRKKLYIREMYSCDLKENDAYSLT